MLKKRFYLFALVFLIITGCNPDLEDWEEVSVDFFEEVAVDFDVKSATEYLADPKKASELPEVIQKLKAKNSDTKNVQIFKIGPYVFLYREDSNDGMLLALKKVDEEWKIEGFQYEEKPFDNPQEVERFFPKLYKY